jgi:site-specific DNA-methyltransferase (adenine-specific)
VTATILTGDCLDLMRTLADNSVDAVVTDPPYHLTNPSGGPHGKGLDTPYARAGAGAGAKGFMGNAWDGGDIAFRASTWAEVLRVAKPGAYLLAFGGARTYHRLAVAIEDAGWEIRDSIMWIYGSGFPKSKNGPWGGTALKPAHEPIIMARKPLIGTIAANVAAYGTGGLNIDGCRIPTDDELRTGAGVIPCRHDEHVPRGRVGEASANARYSEKGVTDFAATPGPRGGDIAGRWPANVIHDGSDAVLTEFPEAQGQQGHARNDGEAQGNRVLGALRHVTNNPAPRGDSGSAARFFYCAKATAKDRESGLAHFEKRAAGMVPDTSGQHVTRHDEGYQPPQRANHHPTVKPTDLMRYLCRLVTPAGGVVLDPFMGSGSTGRGAVLEGFRFVGMEMDAEYAAIAIARISQAERDRADETRQSTLFEKTA